MDSDARPWLRLVTADDPPAPATAAAQRGLRAAIATVGAGQVLLGLAQIAGVSLVDLVDGGHLGNESAAWNVAVGAALLGVARAGHCSSAVFIMLTAFVGVLSVVTFSDALNARVGPARIATHSLVVAGYLMVIWLRRKSRRNQSPMGDD
jgi:predicted anti-sigma-YlaC factor YlaD